MAENSKIEWTGATWNPFIGCEKVSQGCKFCYAETLVENRFKRKFRDVKQTKPPTFYFPVRYSRTFTGNEPFYEWLVFTCSLSDFFIEQGDEFRPELWDIIRDTPNLIYQVLTKRPERIAASLPPDWGAGYPNVWLGVTTEDQKSFDERVPILSRIPARVRFLSVEPMLGPIEVNGFLPVIDMAVIDWVILGGESGQKGKFRPASIDWFDSVIRTCRDLDVPVFFKQLGTHLAKEYGMSDSKGGKFDELPAGLRVRQWPKVYETAQL